VSRLRIISKRCLDFFIVEEERTIVKRLIIGILPLTVWGIAPPVEAEVAAKLLGQADVLAQGEVLPVKAEVATEFPIQADVLAQGEVPAQISNVILNSTERELEIIFETLEGDSLLIDANRFRTEGKQLIAEIPNGVLSLSTGQAFSVDNPTADIAQVQVTQLQGETVQVVVTGQDGLPTRDVVLRSGILAYVLNPGENEIAQELVITGEQDSPYVEPIASTATRTDTPLRDVPQSIQVIPQEVLEDQQVVRLNEALRNASGVVAGSNDPRGQRFNIRGFDSSAVLRDGFRLTNGGTGNIGFPELANIEQIEVLKGPAAILFGALEPGGVVNLVSKKPLSEPVYDVGFRLGNRGFVEPSVDISGPLEHRYRSEAHGIQEIKGSSKQESDITQRS
jgi:iron complex outermembrane receptor protein